jgi:hypothetical protein
MSHGGKRPGAGRPRGPTRTKHPPSRELTLMRKLLHEEMKIRAAKTASAGKGRQALEVLQENMMWAQGVGRLMFERAERALQEGAIPAALDWLNEASKMWWFAHKCAKAILPYESARLAPITSAPPHKCARRLGEEAHLW